MIRAIAVRLCLTACLSVGSLGAQQDTTTTASQTIRVYLDCEYMGCDFDYFRTELTMVNWVRDRQVADVHILVTMQQTGAGGREYTITFIGLRQFSGLTDTLKYVSPPAASQDEMRKGMAAQFRLGLVRYFARTPSAARITVSFGDTTKAQGQTSTKRDPWKAWVFRISGRGFTFGEEQFKDFNGNADINADRVTEMWKTSVNFGKRYGETRQTYPTCDTATPPVCKDTTYINIRKGDNASLLQVRALGPRLSTGIRITTRSSTYDNFRRVTQVFPALEYNVFPYAQSTRKQLTFEYNIGYGQYSYNDTTIFDKISEGMPMQRLLVGVAARQPWGSIDVGSAATYYMNGRDEYNIGSYGQVTWKIFRGFEIDLFGEYAQIEDQFYLRKKDFSQQEILTRSFQLPTSYRFFGQLGIRYTFGSIYNNVVNPRMGGGFFF
jgi:hypothetical protein